MILRNFLWDIRGLKATVEEQKVRAPIADQIEEGEKECCLNSAVHNSEIGESFLINKEREHSASRRWRKSS